MLHHFSLTDRAQKWSIFLNTPLQIIHKHKDQCVYLSLPSGFFSNAQFSSFSVCKGSALIGKLVKSPSPETAMSTLHSVTSESANPFRTWSFAGWGREGMRGIIAYATSTPLGSAWLTVAGIRFKSSFCSTAPPTVTPHTWVKDCQDYFDFVNNRCSPGPECEGK